MIRLTNKKDLFSTIVVLNKSLKFTKNPAEAGFNISMIRNRQSQPFHLALLNRTAF